ncbi:alpha/beta hydrolase fold domain-containing protein [Pseudalkalibacillus hwajinpoensis]|uniref:alpha/beta hydrolase fold domain-containing protein n=1 Tax=Guptibacillus hwajinpoensis TaxID=208199 RepID=UPI001CD666B3|nr:alpha/beta hydrolase fold domain-containing protein [Pseudalkalibacillus hwajinpoensis]MCA0993391.1 alpha/beta hydrolase fold domain-containing protein [Pseudalkalibacillus hwajinpoensis]
MSSELESNMERETKSPLPKKFILQASYWKAIQLLAGINLLFSLFYLSFRNTSPIWNVFGVLFLVMIVMSILGVLRQRKLSIVSMLYLLFLPFALILIGLLNFQLSNQYPGETSSAPILIPSLFLLVHVVTLIFAWRMDKERNGRVNGIPRWFSDLLIWGNVVALIVGLFTSSLILFRYENGGYGPYVNQLALFYAFVFLASTVLVLQGSKSWIRPRQTLRRILMSGGFAITFVHFLPLLSVPIIISQAEEQVEEAFSQWDSTSSEFQQTPFSLPAYFLGLPPADVEGEKDVLFYEGTEGVDDGVELRFDSFLPKEKDGKLPVLIRIHGGSWANGDKGDANVMQQNTYFAEQGYAVFDIQYGLTTLSSYGLSSNVPDHVRGPFSIDDQVRHIGLFTQYLTEHAEEYDLDLSTTFISGGSAGGHLATASALAMTEGKYGEWFSEKLKVKGLIPYYPANKGPALGGIPGTEELLWPEQLVSEESPPALLFHGTHDTYVGYETAASFKETYAENDNKKAAVIYMPFGNHGSDFYFAGYYSQTFTYYMERFMASYR